MKILKYYPKKQIADIEWQGKTVQISEECALLHRINIFSDIPDDIIPALISESEDIICKQYLYSQLDKYFKTKSMYYKKLLEKGFSKSSAKKAVDSAENSGFINDRYFAERYVETYASKKGRFAIKRDLSAKGIPSNIIDEVLADTPTDKDNLYRLAKKLCTGNTPKDKASLYRKLLSRGFCYDEINSVLNLLYEEWE